MMHLFTLTDTFDPEIVGDPDVCKFDDTKLNLISDLALKFSKDTNTFNNKFSKAVDLITTAQENIYLHARLHHNFIRSLYEILNRLVLRPEYMNELIEKTRKIMKSRTNVIELPNPAVIPLILACVHSRTMGMLEVLEQIDYSFPECWYAQEMYTTLRMYDTDYLIYDEDHRLNIKSLCALCPFSFRTMPTVDVSNEPNPEYSHCFNGHMNKLINGITKLVSDVESDLSDDTSAAIYSLFDSAWVIYSAPVHKGVQFYL